MQCKSCSEAIPTKFAHAIKSNSCPFCGSEIMEAALQTILTSLQTLMKDAEPYMEAVEEWFGANYSLHKGSKKQTIEVKSNSSDDDTFDEEAIRKQTEAAKSAISFQKRAGIKGSDIKSLVEKIQSGGGAADPSEFKGIDPDYGEIDMSNEQPQKPLSQNEALAMAQAINTGVVSEDPVEKYYEIEKIKKLQRQQPTGQGKFSRGG